MNFDIIKNLLKPADTKILFLVIDGLGGLSEKPLGKTELQTAHTPYLDALANDSICGLHLPIGPGITPGSGPSHLALFGYDPIKFQVGRGVLSALGIDFDLKPHDLAARGNFCTLDDKGLVTDRRAGRISNEKNQQLCQKLSQIQIPGVKIFVQTVKEHRFLLVLRTDDLNSKIADTDPQRTDAPPLIAKPLSTDAKRSAKIVNYFLDKAKNILADSHPANMVLLRGFAMLPQWPTFREVFGLKAAAIASYPMYKGLAKLIGMSTLKTNSGPEAQLKTLKKQWDSFDFFYFHFKDTDSAGEDGDFDRKVKAIEKIDALIPQVRKLQPSVIVVTGDHSTPAKLKYHSWHPVPVLLWSDSCRQDPVKNFDEISFITGGLGPNIPAVDLMPLVLANAGRLEKFGA